MNNRNNKTDNHGNKIAPITQFRKNDEIMYLSDEALQRLIADTESEPLLHPPKGFKGEIMERIDRKRKYRKNMQLFSYSVKVIAATAAAVAVLLIVPDNIQPERDVNQSRQQYRQEQQERERTYVENPTWRLNRKLNEYYGMLNDSLNQLFRMEVNFDEKEKE